MAHETGTYVTELSIDTAERARTLRRLIQRNSPVDTGALKRSWNDPRTVQIEDNGTVIIDNPKPYARIQDTGGDVPPYQSPPGQVMRAVIDGQVRFFTKRKGFHLPGHQYVLEALQEFAATPAALVGPPLKLQWAGGGPTLSLLAIAREVLAAAVRREAQGGT